MIWPWTNLSDGAQTISCAEMLEIIMGAVEMQPLFTYEHLDRLQNDSRYLVLSWANLERFAESANRAADRYPWREATGDCDDIEALFRADRVKARWRCGFKYAEAMGGIDYLSRSRGEWQGQDFIPGLHRAAWGIGHKNGIRSLKIYQPDAHVWQAANEVVSAQYLDS